MCRLPDCEGSHRTWKGLESPSKNCNISHAPSFLGRRLLLTILDFEDSAPHPLLNFR